MGSPKCTVTDTVEAKIHECSQWRFLQEVIELKTTLTTNITRLPKRSNYPGPRILKVSFLTQQMATAALEAFYEHRRFVPAEIRMRPYKESCTFKIPITRPKGQQSADSVYVPITFSILVPHETTVVPIPIPTAATNYLDKQVTVSPLKNGGTPSAELFSNSTEYLISVSTTELHPSGQPFSREAQLTSRSSVSCLYTNTQGLLSKLAELRDTMASDTFSLVGLTETWLTDEITDAEIAIPGFSVLRSDRGSQGGGVAPYYSTQLKLTVINDRPFQSRETLWCMLPLDATDLRLVAVTYRPPNNSPEADTLLLSDLNQFFARGHTHVLLMVVVSRQNCLLCDLIPLYNHVLQPTRFRSNDTPSILDLLLTNGELTIDVHYLPSLGASDHVCLQFEFVCHASRVADVSTFTRRHVNFSLLLNLLLANTPSNCAFADSDIAWRDFAFFFQTLISIATITTNLPVASIRHFRLCSRTRKWICRRNSAWLAYAYARSPDTWETFRSLRNHCVTLICMAKQEYQRCLARSFAANPKYLYKNINSTRRMKPGITTLTTPTDTVTTPTQAADVLRAQYVSAFTPASNHTPLIPTIHFGPSLTDIEFTPSNVISKLLHQK
ncbi:hypothetical protein P879_08818 [Paragonimus westermani]|uniref:Uncharacterized protein n=1 Tax=Paragonimus westermani TaxID=34504 RepID=A0A8T0DPZ1_9TREM|nr:hypothetical protein P879_08818 [Paragonimus westermani]